MSWNSYTQTYLKELSLRGQYRKLNQSIGLNFTSNDYLGLRFHPQIIEAGKEALSLWGVGSGGSRLLSGHSYAFERLESTLCEFFKTPAALVFSSGYLANLSLIQVLSRYYKHVYSDSENHASLIDGIRLSRLETEIVPHLQWDGISLGSTPTLLVSETLFSMSGDLAPLALLKKLQGSTDHFLILDEAHSAGIYGKHGEGIFAPNNPSEWDNVAKVVTFGKAFGVSGAAILGSKSLVELLINEGRGFIFDTAPSPVVVGLIQESIEVVRAEGWRREEIKERAKKVRKLLPPWDEELGQGMLPLRSEEGKKSPIIPIILPSNEKCLRFCENMRELGLELKAIRYPTVPRGAERIRISLNLNVSEENTLSMAGQVGEVWKAFL